ncbi:MAG: hypothetical protein JWP25_3614 [Bradyrhizobium sp.]|nr:hypothetical protein [Bradyrhizobium sp.]
MDRLSVSLALTGRANQAAAKPLRATPGHAPPAVFRFRARG